MYNQTLMVLAKRWKAILLLGIVFAVVTDLVSLVFPLEYRAEAQVLIISKSRYGVDPYTSVKSAERVGENLVAIIKTNDFYNKVMSQPNFNIDKALFANVPERTKRKRWMKMIEPSVVYGTGVLNISAYHKDPSQAIQLAGASATALVVSGWEYVGGDVAMKVVNEPVVSRFPVKPNLIFNAVLGLIVGMAIGSVLMVRKYQREV